MNEPARTIKYATPTFHFMKVYCETSIKLEATLTEVYGYAAQLLESWRDNKMKEIGNKLLGADGLVPRSTRAVAILDCLSKCSEPTFAYRRSRCE